MSLYVDLTFALKERIKTLQMIEMVWADFGEGWKWKRYRLQPYYPECFLALQYSLCDSVNSMPLFTRATFSFSTFAAFF